MINILLHAYIGGRAHPDILYKSTGHFILNSVAPNLIILKTTRPNIFHTEREHVFIHNKTISTVGTNVGEKQPIKV